MRLLMSILLFTIGHSWKPTVGSSEQLICIEAKSTLPILSMTGKASQYESVTTLFYSLGNKHMFKLSYLYTQTINGKIVDSGQRYHFLLFMQDSAYGYDIDINKEPVKSRVNIDSAMRYEWIRANKIYPVLTQNISILTASKTNADSGIIEDTYLIKDKTDSAPIANAVFTYSSKFPALDVSLSRELDSLKHMKLTKTRIVSFSRFMKEYNMTVGEFYTNSEIRLIPVENETEIMKYFDQLQPGLY